MYWEHLDVHRYRSQQIDVQRDQLLPLQPGRVGLHAASLGRPDGALSHLVQERVYFRRSVLYPSQHD